MLDDLRQKSERYRHIAAFISASSITLIILLGWAFNRGYLNLPNTEVSYKSQEQTASLSSAPSPLENSKTALEITFGQLREQYNQLKETLSNVFVPFISGIEVYQSK